MFLTPRNGAQVKFSGMIFRGKLWLGWSRAVCSRHDKLFVLGAPTLLLLREQMHGHHHHKHPHLHHCHHHIRHHQHYYQYHFVSEISAFLVIKSIHLSHPRASEKFTNYITHRKSYHRGQVKISPILKMISWKVLSEK